MSGEVIGEVTCREQVHGLGLSVENGVAVISFDAPRTLNGIDEANIDVFPDLVRAAALSPGTRYVVVRGTAHHFCSGASVELLRTLARIDEERRIAVIRRAQAWVLALLRCPLPTVAAIDGLVAGAGFDLSLAFDVRLAGPGVRMNFWYAKLGVIPDLGAFQLLGGRFGRQRALEMYARSETWSREKFVALGLAEEVEAWPSSPAEWLVLLSRRLPVERAAFAAAKELALGPLIADLEPHLARSAALQAEMIGAPSFRQAVDRIDALQKTIASRAPR